MLKLVFNNWKLNEYRSGVLIFRSLSPPYLNSILRFHPPEVHLWIQTPAFILIHLKNNTVLLNAQNHHLSILIYNLINNKRQKPFLAFILKYVVYHFLQYSFPHLKNAGHKQSKPLFDARQAAQMHVLNKRSLFDKGVAFYVFYSRRSKKSGVLWNILHW